MALMEYCLVNIVLGDFDAPKPPPSAKQKKIFEMKKTSAVVNSSKSAWTPAQIARNRAIYIDRFSRIFFPLLFCILNVTYWILFAEYI